MLFKEALFSKVGVGIVWVNSTEHPQFSLVCFFVVGCQTQTVHEVVQYHGRQAVLLKLDSHRLESVVLDHFP